jgi:hypothetical protein
MTVKKASAKVSVFIEQNLKRVTKPFFWLAVNVIYPAAPAQSRVDSFTPAHLGLPACSSMSPHPSRLHSSTCASHFLINFASSGEFGSFLLEAAFNRVFFSYALFSRITTDILRDAHAASAFAKASA